MKKQQHWLTEAILTAHNNGSSYMEASYSIMFQFHGALENIMREGVNICGEVMTPERKMQEVQELNEGLNEALEALKQVKGLL
ncbi:hypothetical protein [Bacillus wiedmannii]|uniref:hypothetical protein n=1 Tax=Bacillus wiedmannii TaxID=1890302 RepID=UPI0012445DC2|nr:hypothetical protein [Bacillus wiedmannii]